MTEGRAVLPSIYPLSPAAPDSSPVQGERSGRAAVGRPYEHGEAWGRGGLRPPAVAIRDLLARRGRHAPHKEELRPIPVILRPQGRRIRILRPCTFLLRKRTGENGFFAVAQNDKGGAQNDRRKGGASLYLPPQSGCAGQRPRPGGAIRAGGRRPPLPHPCGAFVGAAYGRPPCRHGATLFAGRRTPRNWTVSQCPAGVGGFSASPFLFWRI